jgi:hypothetical protein
MYDGFEAARYGIGPAVAKGLAKGTIIRLTLKTVKVLYE